MIQLAIIFQVLALLFAVKHCSNKAIHQLDSGEVKAGQIYESLYEGRDGEPSAIFLRTVLGVKDGYVKYRLQGYSWDSGVETVCLVSEFKRLRRIAPKPNPFESETKQ